MSPYSHNNGTSGGKSSDKPQEFNADTFETYVKKFFIDNRVITEVSCDYADNKLTVHIFFGEPCSKFSFTFVVYFKNTITSKKEKTSYLQEVIYEFPDTAFVDMSLNESVFRVLHYQVKKRYKGAFAELQVSRILGEDKEKDVQSRVLVSVLDYLIADTKTDKYAGIDIRLVVMTSKGREFLPIDIKSYENGLREVKDGVAGLFVDIHMSDEVILHKIKTLVEGFVNGQYLRI
ncbi:MAG: hypothetical protein K9M36_01540 [Candidatus Pacebacteria bacterium]|nr:hypothetical protein [Candidatus Paceibacterota bacterium]